MFGRPDGVIAETIGELDLLDAFVKRPPLALRRRLENLDFEKNRESHGQPAVTGRAILSKDATALVG
jgi:hypothetical protein